MASTIINTGATLSVAVLALLFYSAGAAWALTALCFVSSGVGVGLVITDMALKRVRGPFIEAAKLAWLSGSVMMCVGFAVIVGLTFNQEPAEFFGVMKACSFYLVSGIINAGASAGLAQWQASQRVAVVVETRHPPQARLSFTSEQTGSRIQVRPQPAEPVCSLTKKNVNESCNLTRLRLMQLRP